MKTSQDQGVPFHHVPAGKWRRYFSLYNFTDLFKTAVGIIKAWWLLGKLQPDLIFSKGGYVSFPVVYAGHLRKIPIIAHESDVVPGLTTRLCFPFVTKQFLGFETSKKYFKNHPEKLVFTGIPLRESILHGSGESGLQFLQIAQKSKPILLILGGSLGAASLNKFITQNVSALLQKFTVVHSTGPNKNTLHTHPEGYHPFEFLGPELADLYQAADIIVSRAGATTLAEILTLRKKALLVPLTQAQSRGDQIVNARLVKDLTNIAVLEEQDITTDTFFAALDKLMHIEQKHYDNEKLAAFSCEKSCDQIAQLILSYT